ncbi:MAG: hypothetical protein KBC44_02390 [Candidatus Pacebacteria bacterium]|nr:hypothetical protein [Candidatus Paceibacterota bacterium]
MKKVILINKKEGETPLEALEVFRSKNKSYKDLPITYAGRLDPMAEGLLLLLAGEECKQKDKYLGLDKEYEFKVLFGFSTDTYDILGKVLKTQSIDNLDINKIKKELNKLKGKVVQKYPIYSSRTVSGKPLFTYARNNTEVEIPEKEVTIKKLSIKKLEKMNNKRILENIEKRIQKVKGDFRQKEILKIWKEKLKNQDIYFIGSFSIKCSSGTYVRSIANSLGDGLHIPALAFSIKRTKLGKWGRI